MPFGEAEGWQPRWKAKAHLPGVFTDPNPCLGMERVYLRNGDKELLLAGLAPLESFHEWYWRERDIMGTGLVGVGAYDGVTQNARYETYDHEIDLDGLKMIPHPFRDTGANNGAWYGDIAIPSNTFHSTYHRRLQIWKRFYIFSPTENAMARRGLAAAHPSERTGSDRRPVTLCRFVVRSRLH